MQTNEPESSNRAYDGYLPVLALKPIDAARAIGISTRLLWSMTNRGDIPCVRIGRRVVYPLHLLREWLETNARGAGR